MLTFPSGIYMVQNYDASCNIMVAFLPNISFRVQFITLPIYIYFLLIHVLQITLNWFLMSVLQYLGCNDINSA